MEYNRPIQSIQPMHRYQSANLIACKRNLLASKTTETKVKTLSWNQTA